MATRVTGGAAPAAGPRRDGARDGARRESGPSPLPPGQPLPADAGRAVGQRRTRKLSAPGRQGVEYRGLWNDAVQHGGPGQPHVYLTVEYTRLVFKIRFLSHISHVCSRCSNAARGRHRSPHGWASWDTPGTAENTRAARSRGSRGPTAPADQRRCSAR